MDTAKALAPDYDGMDQVRVALGLLQARAMECRHLSGKLMVDSFQSPASKALAIHLNERSAAIEKFAAELAEKYLERTKVQLQ